MASFQNSSVTSITSSALKELFYRYTHLTLGGKEIVCPYWVNRLKQGIFGPGGGKGTPEQIIEVTSYEAKRTGNDLEKMSALEIENYMKKKRIGVDCSGFVFWMLDSLDREKGGNGVVDDIPGSAGRYLQARANVRMLTDGKITVPVKLSDIQVGDMIRLNSGKHVAIVILVQKAVGGLAEIEYAHSSNRTMVNGVHSARIKVIEPEKELADQEWLEKAADGSNYGQKFFLPLTGDGIVRLKTWV